MPLPLDTSSQKDSVPYILFYRQAANPYPLFSVFYHPSHDIRVVVDRVKRHCELMSYRFVSVRPLIVDLDKAEQRLYGTQEMGLGA